MNGSSEDNAGHGASAAGPDRLDHISALADGQLRDKEFAAAVHHAVHDRNGAAAWRSLHVIGDVLRFGESAGKSADNGFLNRFSERLAHEPTPVRPRTPVEDTTKNIAAKDQYTRAYSGFDLKNPAREAANSPNFRWKMVAGLASVVAVGAIGWNLLGPLAQGGSTRLASDSTARTALRSDDKALVAAPPPRAAAPIMARNEPAQMIRDPRLDELLAAHEQSAGISALQMPAGFLRNATFESRDR